MASWGFWERRGRNPALGAFIATTMIAALYSLAGNVVFLVYMLGDLGGMRAVDWASFRTGIMERYQIPILGLTMGFQFLFFGGATFFIFSHWHGAPFRKSFRLSLPRPLALPLAILGLAGIFPLAVLAGELFERAFPFISELEQPSQSLMLAKSPAAWAFLMAAVCATPALCEEFLFRGYLQGNVGRVIREPWSYLLTGSYFALIHQNYFGLGALIVIGVYLAFVFETSGSIYPGMAVHFLYNATALLLTNLGSLPAWAFDAKGFVRLPLVLAALPLAAAGVLALLAVERKRRAGAPHSA